MSSQLSTYSLHRMSTGIAGLDVVLRGGLFRGGMYFVAGAPGTGKTTLANQMCFAHVTGGGRAIYITLQTEHHSRMLAHLSGFSFFAPEHVGDALQYFSGTSAQQSGTARDFVQYVQRIIRDQRASLLVIDGLENFKAHGGNGQLVKEALHALHAYTESSGCTLILLGPASPPPTNYEETIVDGVIYLRTDAVGLRTVRLLEVGKIRGSAFIPGKHIFVVGDDGITVYPRTEAVLATPSKPVAASHARLAFDIAGLDTMLQGGVFAGSTTMLLGTPGSGKTILGLHFLAAGARLGEPALYFGLYETPDRLIAKADRVGLDFSAKKAAGQIEVEWISPVEGLLDFQVDRLLQLVRRLRVRRLFLDGIDAFQHVMYPERIGQVLMALSNELRAQQVTTFLSAELRQLVGPQVDLPIPIVSPIAENILFLRSVELGSTVQRLISIVKIRDGGYDPTIREFVIGSQGIAIGSAIRNVDRMLTGTARHVSVSSETSASAGGGSSSVPPDA